MEVRTVEQSETAVLRVTTPVEKLPEVMGNGYRKIFEYLSAQGMEPAGAPFALYHNMDMSALDVEIGMPVAGAVEGDGEIKAGRIPAGKAAYTLHVGSYEKIGDAYDRLTAFVKEKGLDTQEYCYEYYLNDPRETAPDELKTEIYFPLKD